MNSMEKIEYIKKWLERASEKWIDIVYSLISNIKEKEPGK